MATNLNQNIQINERHALCSMQMNLCFYYSLEMSLMLVFTETLCYERDFLAHNSSICRATEIFSFFSVDHYLYVVFIFLFFFLVCVTSNSHLSFDQPRAKRVVFTLQNENSLLFWNAIYFVIQILFKSFGRTIRQI